MKKYLLLVLSISLLFACTKQRSTLSCPQQGQTVTIDIKYNQTKDIYDCQGSILKATFTKVDEDSRCPTGVTCMWAGRSIITLHLSNGQDIQLEQAKLSGFTWNGFQVNAKLVQLDPYPVYNVPAQLSDYSAKVEFSL